MSRTRIVVTRSLIEAMQAVQDAVADHPFYVHADLPVSKLRVVLRKLRQRLPDLERDRFHAHRRRVAGQPSHRLIVYWPRQRGHTGFFVLLASTDTPNEADEKWRDARDRHQRLVVRSGWWELVRHTRPGNTRPSWTWRMHADQKARLMDAIRQASGRRWTRWLSRLALSARHWPGFAGIRRDHREIGRYFAERWKRSNAGPPPLWGFLPYVTKKNRTGKAREPASALASSGSAGDGDVTDAPAP